LSDLTFVFFVRDDFATVSSFSSFF